MTEPITRRQALLEISVGVGALLTSVGSSALAQKGGPITRPIASSGEQLPVIGIGTARGFDVVSSSDQARVSAVLQKFSELGGRVIDTSPESGRTEAILGAVIANTQLREKLFLADTIVAGDDRSTATSQLNESFRRLQAQKVDLVQVSLSDATADMIAMLNEMKAAGRIRYIGVVGSGLSAYDNLEIILRRERLDFVQVDMSVDDRRAARRIIPLASERGTAVMINHPFGRGRIFQHVLGKAIPAWAKDFDARSWAQIFLKYLVAQPGVTVVIPGTERLEYVVDNMAAARGKLPNESMRRRIEGLVPAIG